MWQMINGVITIINLNNDLKQYNRDNKELCLQQKIC